MATLIRKLTEMGNGAFVNKKTVVFAFAFQLLSIGLVDATECKHGDSDLSVLSGEWVAKPDDNNDVTIKISLCSPLVPNGSQGPNCHSDASVCVIYSNGTALSGGNYTHDVLGELSGAGNADIGESWIILAGDTCPEEPYNNLTTSINLKCGKTLGSPKFLAYMYCVNYFEWETDAYCKGDKPEKEVPCYLYDDAGKRYDLSPLAKTTGGYQVAYGQNVDIFINVCRNIKPDSRTKNCSSSSGACRVSGSSTISLGEPTSRLQRSSSGKLTLKYTSDSIPTGSGCTSKPSTTIVFVCPKRGRSREPLVTLDFDCMYEIEWETEYACPENVLINSSCVLSKEIADINIDLRPLTKPKGAIDPYVTQVKDSNNETYSYFLNVCAELGIPCPDDQHSTRVPVCQTKASNSEYGKRLGSTDHQVLRYADGDLTLIYKGGDLCHHNRFQRTTIIKFICNMSAVDDGHGKPVFDKEEDCTYMFNWGTKYACLDHPVDEECWINNNGKRYDLSALVKTSATNWVALHERNDELGNGEYFINVCHDIVLEGPALGCEAGSAICYKDASGVKNLGKYESNPVYDAASQSIQITYKNGGICAGIRRITSTITFLCRPGNLESSPKLVHVSADNCEYDFEWHTAAACVLGHKEGDNCRVYDEDAGFNFDLSQLMKKPGQYYTVSDPDNHEDHDYLLNVCGPLTGTKCDNLGISSPGVCQVPKSGTGDAYVGGQFSTHLQYFDGMINLTYTGGTPYNDAASTPRKSEITFLCDPDAGVGNPTFLAEINSEHYYGFEWRTSYACPIAPIECSVTDPNTNEQYDFSKLTMTREAENWDVDGPDNTKYYINICRPLNSVQVGAGCDSQASVCRTKFVNGQEQVDIANMGQIKTGLEVTSRGQVKLRLEGPKTCNNGTAMVKYVTTIQFLCLETALVSAPNRPHQDGPCEYTIIWETASSCGLDTRKINNTSSCSVKDTSSDYVFNLKPLMKKGDDAYSVKVGGDTYKLNICGNLSESVCGTVQNGRPATVCKVDSTGQKTGLAMSDSQLTLSDTGSLSLAYDGVRLSNGARNTVQINFLCLPEADLGHPVFVRQEGSTVIFNFQTALACVPKAIDCLVQDSDGNQYDLSSLAKDDSWMVPDTRNPDTKYYINVCRPVNNVPNSECPDAPIGGCQVASNSQSYNTGFIQAQPIARNDGTLSLQYRNGDVCHKGTPQESSRSTRINFFCSDVEAGPVFEAETDTCEYIFNWRTPAACSLESSKGSNCKVVDPRFHYEFDLSPLKKNGSDYNVSHDGYVYLINVCGPLQEAGQCSITTGVGACQTKPGTSFTPVDAGKANANLAYNSGALTLTYTGGKGECHGQYERKTIITFTCDQSTTGTQGPMFIEESFNCQYVFEWKTKYACPPFKSGSCYIKNGTNFYDLSSLAHLDSNYEYTDTILKQKYEINVCRSLVHGKDSRCPYNAAACMVDLEKPETDPNRYKSIGEVNNNMVQVDNGRLLLEYDNGDLCPNGKDRMKTYIMFFCDQKTQDSSPAGHFKVGDCDHHFLWSTAAACPVTSPDHSGQSGDITCSVTHHATGKVIDLSGLKMTKGSNWNVNDGRGHKLEFNVCGPLLGTTCNNGSSTVAACQTELDGAGRKFNAGNLVSNLMFDDGIVVLNLTGGDPCHNKQFERNTIINFVCNRHQGLGRPVFVDETEDCTYYIAWHTELVCEDEIKCTVDVGNFQTLDLSPLSSQTDNVVHSEEDGATFYLSVCKPLVPISGVLCPSGSGACRVTAQDGKIHTSLGKPKSSPTFSEFTKDVTLVYTNGSQCDVDSSKNFTSRIIFSCLRGPVRTSPVFVRKDGCEFVFHWDTWTVCYDEAPPPSPAGDVCGYRDRQTGVFYNFTLLQSKSLEVQAPENRKYHINVCRTVGSPSSCASSMVCRDDGTSFGEPRDYRVVKEGDVVKMSYALGGKCPDQAGTTAQSQIQFMCNRESGIGSPMYLTSVKCNVMFIWQTILVCLPLNNPCSTIIDGHLYDMSWLSQDGGAWTVTDSKGNTFWINICEGVGGAKVPTDCGFNTGACRKTSGGRVDGLGSVLAQKTLYKNSETGAVVLEYSHGGAACGHNRRRSDNDVATTRINFICGETYGRPSFVESDENAINCVFEFDWKTKLACKVERENVTISLGKVIDPRTGGTIDLQAIFNKKFTDSEKQEGGGTNTYTIQLNGTNPDCEGGAVCQINGGTQNTILGSQKSAKYYIDDKILEGRYTSSAKCPSSPQKKVSSIIQFHCSKENQEPKLLYKSKNSCLYVFSWETDAACFQIKNLIPSTNNSSSGAGSAAGSPSNSSHGGMSTKTIVGIVGMFLAAIVLCVLLVVFHKQERRVSCLNAIRGLYGHKSSEYTQLPADITDDLAGENDIITITDPADTESHREEEPVVMVTPTPASYHDDSDEDLLA